MYWNNFNCKYEIQQTYLEMNTRSAKNLWCISVNNMQNSHNSVMITMTMEQHNDNEDDDDSSARYSENKLSSGCHKPMVKVSALCFHHQLCYVWTQNLESTTFSSSTEKLLLSRPISFSTKLVLVVAVCVIYHCALTINVPKSKPMFTCNKSC